jgi:hypothetical protein
VTIDYLGHDCLFSRFLFLFLFVFLFVSLFSSLFSLEASMKLI